MFFYPWYPALMLAVESNNVIDIRLRSIATGKVNAKEETRLMVSEKVDAALEAFDAREWPQAGRGYRLLPQARRGERGAAVLTCDAAAR